MRVTSAGEQVEITGVEGEWYKVTAGGVTGYIRGDYISMTEIEAPASTAASASIGEQIVEFAEQYPRHALCLGRRQPLGL